jgi:hypothetical protein
MTSYHNAYADNISLTLSGNVAGLAPAAAAPPVADIPALDHVYVVMMENTNYSDVVHATGRSVAIDARMPFFASLAANGVLLTNMWGTYHPSDQNYVAMVAGDTYRYGPVYYPDYDLPVTHLDNFDVGVSLAKQDAFLKSTFNALVESPAWKTSRSLLIVTWDKSSGWGWPDNRVPTVLVGSPGLLRAGAVIDGSYDGYSVLRTIESAFGLESLGRFDRFAAPLNAAFADCDAPETTAVGNLRADEAAATRGGIADTFGRVTTLAAVTPGLPLTLIGPEGRDADVAVNLEPLGHVPTVASAPYRFDDETGEVTIPTDRLTPGFYGAWLRHGKEPPYRAPLPVTILPPPRVHPDAPGVEIVGATRADDAAKVSVREGSNLIVRYCRPAGAEPADTWIGIFAAGTPSDQMTKDNANVIGFWLKTPGEAQHEPCGEAMAFASELTPGTDYQVLLFRNAANGTSAAVGPTAAFTLTPALP